MEVIQWTRVARGAAFHAARSSRTQSRPLLYHGHDFAEIFWIDSGHALHRVNGGAFPLSAGTLVMMRSTDCHGIEIPGKDELKYTNIAFPQETLDFLHTRYFNGRDWIFSPSGKFPATQQIEPSRLRRFNRWADELAESPRERLHIERFLLNILVELNRDQQDAPLDDSPDWLVTACRQMQLPKHFSGGVVEFLRLCGRSREHVARTVHRHFKMTPTAYVNRIRIEYAKRQLEMGDQPILEIALDCGIGNLSHFYDLFRTHTSLTPRAYRLAHRKPL